MSKKVLVATEKPFAKDAVDSIKKITAEAGYELILLEKYTDNAQFLEAVADVDALIIRSDKVTPEVIEAGKNLKIVVRAGAGYDNVNLNAATEKDIVVMNTPGQNSNAVAELVIGLMLNLARCGYSGKSGSELKGKTIGIHAYGNIGLLVNKIAKGFGMKVCAYDPFVSKERMISDDVKPVGTVEELYEVSDYVSIHLPKIKETIGSINYELMSKMKKGAAIINTARKEVVDEESLMKIMADRDDLLYAADVAPDCRAELVDNHGTRVFFTAKKMGAQTGEANVNAGMAAITQIVRYLEKGDRTFQVNK
jgi:D-3-phosphoglycerate dehydrogenase / 2-oxoglutarate reductase